MKSMTLVSFSSPVYMARDDSTKTTTRAQLNQLDLCGVVVFVASPARTGINNWSSANKEERFIITLDGAAAILAKEHQVTQCRRRRRQTSTKYE